MKIRASNGKDVLVDKNCHFRASHHELALETHIMKAKEAGVTDDEIKHALLLLIQTTGFPTFMEAYSVFNKM